MFGIGGGGMGGIFPLYAIFFIINLIIKALSGQLGATTTTPV